MEAVEEMITNLTHDQNAFQHVVSKKIIHPIDFNTVKYSTYFTVNINFRC